MKQPQARPAAPKPPFVTLAGEIGAAQEAILNARSVANLLIDLTSLAPGQRVQLDADGLDEVLRQMQTTLTGAHQRLIAAFEAAAEWDRSHSTTA